jgi:hypothetical protein
VTYRAEARARIQDEDVALRENVTSGWAKRNGRWLNVFAIGTPPPESVSK